MEKEVGTFDVIIGESKSAEEGGPTDSQLLEVDNRSVMPEVSIAKGR